MIQPSMTELVPYFTMCQEIGGVLQERGRAISLAGVFFPVFHAQIKDDLEYIKKYADNALKVVDAAKAEWDKTALADKE